MHQKVPVRNVPGIGACQGEHQQVINREGGDCLLACQHIFWRTQLADQGNLLILQLRGLLAPYHDKRMVMPLGRRCPEVVGATPANGEVLTMAAFDVQDLHHVVAAGRADKTADLEANARIAHAFFRDQCLEPLAECRPVERVLRVLVINAHAASDVEQGQLQTVFGAELAEGATVAADQSQVSAHIKLMRQHMKMQALQFQPGLITQQLQRFVQCVFVQAEGGRFTAHHQTAIGCFSQFQVQAQQDRRPLAPSGSDARQAA